MSKVYEYYMELKEMGIDERTIRRNNNLYKNLANALKDMLDGEDEFIDEDLYMEHMREKNVGILI